MGDWRLLGRRARRRVIYLVATRRAKTTKMERMPQQSQPQPVPFGKKEEEERGNAAAPNQTYARPGNV